MHTYTYSIYKKEQLNISNINKINNPENKQID